MKKDSSNDLKLLAEEIKRRTILTQYLTPAKKRGYVCIGCGNGSGDDGTGAEISKDGTRLLCGKCQKGSSNIDIIANHLGIGTSGKDFFDVVKFGCQEFGLPFVNSDETATTNEKVEKFDKLDESQENLVNFVNSQGGKWRGLSLGTLQHSKCGFLPNVYFPAAEKELPAVVIPNDLGGVYFRAIDGKFHKNNKPMATTTIYLPNSNSFDLIITEGQINALSILQAVPNPNFGVMACSGTSGEKVILDKLKELDAQGKKFRVILAFDKDSNNAGQNAAKNLLKSLTEADYTACSIDITGVNDLDLNDVLTKGDEIYLSELMDTAVEDAKAEFGRIATKGNQALFGKSPANIFPTYKNSLTAKFADRKTGFSNLDKEIVFLPGIYVIGGLPALGKTTFALQLLEQVAQNGTHCFFCSFEMADKFLYAKWIARRVYQLESLNNSKSIDKPLTAIDILNRKFSNHEDNFDKVLESLTKENVPFYIWELDEIDIDKLLERVEKICTKIDKPPIICLDYLQLLAVNTEQAKAGIDSILRKLKTFQRATDTTFVIVSSLNRLNYNNEISFESFKESGGIEYTADVMWGLQFLLSDEEDRNTKTLDKAKRETPRHIQLKCLKNRFGSNFDIGFNYFSAVDYFQPMDELSYLEFTETVTDKTKTKKSKSKSKSDDDEFKR